MPEMYDILILGGGPAGLTASIYGARSGLKTAVIENALPGGVAATTHRIDNYPGFPEGVRGSELTDRMLEQAKKFDVEVIIKQPVDIEKKGDICTVKTKDTDYEAKALIIATGTHAKRLQVKGEGKFWGRGVSYCAVCDGPFYKGMDVAIIGCGNSGIQEGIYMLKFSPKVYFVEFLPQMTADKILQDEIKSQSNVEFHLNSEIIAINGEDTVTSITVKNRDTGEEKDISVQGVFIYVGLIPNTEFLKGKIELDEKGYIKTNSELETSVPGIFAAGDVRTKILRQVSTAVGDGALAAYLADEYIRKNFKD